MPRRYDLTIVPISTARFTGEVTIALDVSNASRRSCCTHDLEVELETLAQSGRTTRCDAHRRPRRRTCGSPRPISPSGRDVDPAFPGSALRQPRRVLPEHLHRRRRHDAHPRDDAVRSAARPSRLSLLRRTGFKAVFAITRRRRHARRDSTDRSPRAPEASGRSASATPSDVDAWSRHHRPARALEPVDVDRIRCAGQRTGSRPPRGVRERGRSLRAAVLRRLLRDPVPRGQARSRGASRLRVRRDGEPRVRDLPRVGTARRSRRRDASRGGPGRVDHRARDRAHVVRRPSR